MRPIPARARLIPLVKRKRALRLWSRMALCWLTGCCLGLLMLFQALRAGRPELMLLLLLIACTVGALLWVWSHHRRSAPDWQGCARDVEKQHPELDGRLLTAIEQEPDESGQMSYLQEQLSKEVLAHDRLVRWEKLMPPSRVGFAKLAHALAFAAFLVTCLRILHWPVGPDHGIRFTGDLQVTPGNTELERGENLVVMARFNRQPPANVDLLVRSADGDIQRIPLVKSLQDPVFGGSVPAVTNDLHYSVEYGSRRTRDFEVTVFDYPKLERADATLEYPAYTKLPPKTIANTRRITAVEGTCLNLTLELNKRVAAARLVSQSEDEHALELEPVATGPVLQLTGLVMTTSERYTLHLVDDAGRTNQEPETFVLLTLSNRVPAVKITAPQGDIRPSALEEVTCAGTVFDDFGVLAYGIAYAIGGENIRTLELGRDVPGRSKQSFRHVFALESLEVSPGDLVTWFYWSEDIGPDGNVRHTMGDLYFAAVRPFDEVFRQGAAQFGQGQQGGQMSGGGGGGQSAELMDLQQQIIHATWKLRREQAQQRSRPDDRPQSLLRPPDTRPTPIDELYHAGESVQPSRTDLNGFLRRIIDTTTLSSADGGAFFGQRNIPRGGGQATTEDAGPRAAATDADPENTDLQVIMDAQREAIALAQEALSRQRNPAQAELWAEIIHEMESVLTELGRVETSPDAWEEALAAQQAAYQRLLRLMEEELAVSQQRNANNNSGQSGRQRQMQRQLDQLDLTPEENRYETERLASAPQSAAQREQLQVMSRLAELARRQQDINERLQELQTALETAPTADAREQARRELKRLQDEQREMLDDVDELRQRMQNSADASQFTDQQQQLEQTRDSIQRAADASEEGGISEALAAGTRAQRDLQQMREELRNQSASAFAEDMRELRAEARELAREQTKLQEQIEAMDEPTQRRLGESDASTEVEAQLNEQRERLRDLVDQASAVSQLAEDAEPLMSGTLYDTLREFSQDDLGAVKQLQEELLANGLFPIYERLKEVAQQSDTKTLDATAAVLEEGIQELATRLSAEAQSNIDDLARGIERAAELVLGDDTEALRRAEQALEELTDELASEIRQAADTGTNAQTSASQGAAATTTPLDRTGEQGGSQQAESASAGSQAEAGPQNEESQPDGQGRSGGNTTAGRSSTDQEPDPQQAADTMQPGANAGGGSREPSVEEMQRFLAGDGRGGNNEWTGPITGQDFGPWSDRLREVEEMVELPYLRNELIRAREQARQFRRAYTRDQQKPDWAEVRLRILNPLIEVRSEIGDELARRQSNEEFVPIDRDPVPERYSEVVRQYYERLSSDEE